MNKDERMNSDLKIITDRLIEDIPAIISIVLVGGYGRSEGSWVYNEEKDEYLPYNDYDIVVVTENQSIHADIENIRKELAEKVGIKWIDITIISNDQLKKLHPTIYYYDLKYASRVIFGRIEILDEIPVFRKNEITLWDVEALFFTRLWTFMGCMGKEGFDKKQFMGDEARFFKNQMAKAVLATVDAMLIYTHNYEPLYRNKIRRAIEVFPEKEWLETIGKWALNEKLHPSIGSLSSSEARDVYTKIHDIYKTEFSAILKKYYAFNFELPFLIQVNMLLKPYYLIRRIGNILIRRNLKYENHIKLNLAQTYIFFAYDNDSCNNILFKKAIKLVRSIDKKVKPMITWDELRVYIAVLRNGGEIE